MEFPSTVRVEESKFKFTFELSPTATVRSFPTLIELPSPVFMEISEPFPTPIVTNPSTTSSELLSIERFSLPAAEIPPFISPCIFKPLPLSIKISEGLSLGIPSTPVETTTLFSTSNIDSWSIEITPLPVFPKTKSPDETVPSVILFP